jgi:carbamoyl-phosphate synthase large subunit
LGSIAISGLGALQPGGPMVRGIRAGGYQGTFIGLSYNPLEPANYDRSLVERSYLVPYPVHGSAPVLERLLAIHRDHPIDVILPTLDSELPVLIKLQPRLREAGIGMLLPSAKQLALRAKSKLPELARTTGVRIPRTRNAHSYDSARAIAREFAYPFLVKGQLYEAASVSSPQQLEAALHQMANSWGFPVVLQEMIEGVEYDVIVLGGREGELLGAVPMKKLELDINGKAWGGVTIADPALDRLVAGAMEGLRWPGLFELELIRRKSDGEYYLIEINPRVPAWVQLAVAAGQNMPWALYQLALGEEVAPFPDYTVGAMTLRQCVDLSCSMSVFESLAIGGAVDHLTHRSTDAQLPRAKSPGAHRRVEK